jgi:hypothetical protein
MKEILTEDLEDIAAFEDSAKEPLISYEEMIKRLKIDKAENTKGEHSGCK